LLAEPKVKRLLSHEHFSVDGTLLKAWASMKSFRPKDGSGSPPGAVAMASGTSGREAFQRNPREHDRSGRPALSQGPWQESKLCYLGHA